MFIIKVNLIKVNLSQDDVHGALDPGQQNYPKQIVKIIKFTPIS